MLVVLASCFPSYNLTTTAMIQAFGIDLAADGSYDITLQIFEPQGSEGLIALDPGVNNAAMITVNGQTISQAVDRISALQSEYPFTGQNRMVVLGSDLSKQNVEDVFRFFQRNQLTRPNMDVLMAKRTAREVLETDLTYGMVAAQTIEKTLKNAHMRGNILRSPYLSLVQSMYLNNGAGYLPVIEKNKEQNDQKPEEQNSDEQGGEEQGGTEQQEGDQPIISVDQITIKQTALFVDRKLVDILDEEHSKGLLFLKDKIDKRMIEIEDQNNNLASLNIYDCSTKLKPEVCGNQITFVLEIRANASLEESYFDTGDGNARDTWDLMNQLCNQQVSLECEATFDQVIRKNKCDILELQALLQKYYPQAWKKLNGSFQDVMPQIGFRVESDIQVDRVGAEVNQG